MRGTRVKAERLVAIDSGYRIDDPEWKRQWRKWKRVVQRGVVPVSTYKGPGTPEAKSKWSPAWEKMFPTASPMYWERPVRHIGDFFSQLDDAGKADALIVAKAAGYMGKSRLDLLVSSLSRTGRCFG